MSVTPERFGKFRYLEEKNNERSDVTSHQLVTSSTIKLCFSFLSRNQAKLQMFVLLESLSVLPSGTLLLVGALGSDLKLSKYIFPHLVNYVPITTKIVSYRTHIVIVIGCEWIVRRGVGAQHHQY